MLSSQWELNILVKRVQNVLELIKEHQVPPPAFPLECRRFLVHFLSWDLSCDDNIVVFIKLFKDQQKEKERLVMYLFFFLTVLNVVADLTKPLFSSASKPAKIRRWMWCKIARPRMSREGRCQNQYSWIKIQTQTSLISRKCFVLWRIQSQFKHH